MNVFVVGHGVAPIDPAPPRRALAWLVAELPVLAGQQIETWSCPLGRVVITAAMPPPGKLPQSRYCSFARDRAALYAGRPVRWSPEGEAQGAAALNPVRYHEPMDRWIDQLDGRCAVVRASEGSLDLYTDPLGAYPVYTTEARSARWFSNSAAALSRLVEDDSLDAEVLASVLGGGWSLGGHPVWRAVRRLERGCALSLSPDGSERRRQQLPVTRIAGMYGAGCDARRAANDLVSLTGALADWPGRPSVVLVSGGRDSRVILAAARRAAFTFDARTGGAPSDPDVTVARELCSIVDLPHQLLEPDPSGDRSATPDRMARVVALSSGGTATLADGAGFPLGARAGPLPLWHSGQGGEIGRRYFGHSHGAEHLLASFLGRRPGRSEITSQEASRHIGGHIKRFELEMIEAGGAPNDVPDLFYLLERMANWAAVTHAVVEPVRDVTSPLWSMRLLPALIGLPAAERSRDGFHIRLLQHLGPELMAHRFADGRPLVTTRGTVAQRAARTRTLATKVYAELARRRAGRRVGRSAESRSDPSAADPFGETMSWVRDVTLSQPQHSAWAVLDRARVERLLGAPPVALDDMSRYYVWRLGSVFAGLS